jgi:hypothetical protein
MKRYSIPLGRFKEHKPEYPERTAYRFGEDAINAMVYFQVWPNRASLITTYRMQEKGDIKNPWIPWTLGTLGLVCFLNECKTS